MPQDSRLDKVYAKLLTDHPYGWALFKKLTTKDIQPGSCGYFDPDGDWRTLIDLKSPAATLASQGWSVPEDEVKSNGGLEPMRWGPKYSGSVQSRRVGGTAGSTVAAAPVEVSATVSFTNDAEAGAVLTTESPVWRHRIDDEAIPLQWMSDNTAQMLRRHKDIVKKHGIWIVTKTYSTRRCAIAVMTSRSSTVEIGLGVSVQGVLELTPTSEWTNSTGNFCTEIHEDEKGVVVFISGIYFSQRPLRSRLQGERDQVKQRIFREGHDESGYASAAEGEDDVIELTARFFPGPDQTA